MKFTHLKKAALAWVLPLAVIMCAGVFSTTITSNADVCRFYTSFSSIDDAKIAAEQLTAELAADGDILLKNKDNTLPLKTKSWVSVFGVRADNLTGASASSGAFSSDSESSDATVADALEDAGYVVNPTLKAVYDNDASAIGSEITSFSGMVKNSCKTYNDAAFVVLSRTGGEGSDCSTATEETVDETDTHKALALSSAKEGEPGYGKHVKHYLMLTDSEEALIKFVKENFSKVIVVLNTSNAMEINELKNDNGISAIIDIGRPGCGGLTGFGDIINGNVSPSGGLVDEWMADFTADPTWYNFGTNGQNNGAGLAGSNTYIAETDQTSIKDDEGYHGVDYEESIYLGYKYYETYYYDLYNGAYGAGKEEAARTWWKENVAYPFGYGLSYTTFSFNAGEIYTDAGCESLLGSAGLAAKFASSKGSPAEVKKLYVPVTVENTGDVAGKRTVQAYVTAPYTKNGIEKASVKLVGFAKTGIIEPGEEETVTVEFDVQDCASWDYKDANADGNKGDYEMDEGKYIIRFMENSHFDCDTVVADDTDAYDEVSFDLTEKAVLKLDDYSDNELSNCFSEDNGSWDENTKDGDLAYNNIRTADMMADDTSAMTLLSRADMVNTFPKAPATADLTFKDNILSNWGYWDNFTLSDKSVDSNGNEVKETTASVPDESKYPWYKTKDDIPADWTQATGIHDEKHQVQNNRTVNEVDMYYSVATENTIKFSEMSGVAFDDAKWDTFLNQLTYDELCILVEFGGYSTVNIESIGKEKSEDTDGPNNLDSTHCWCSEDIIASTFNTELAYKEGTVVGDLGLLHGVEGWYGPGMDVHRSPFSGRNNEYYSQDGVHGGKMAAAVVQGCRTKGLITYCKHCFMNDQESNRGNLFTWCDEQAIRENNCVAFQRAFQEGESAAAMTGYGRLGGLSNTNNYNMSTKLYQDQWGVYAYFVTDGYIGWKARTDLDMMVRAGMQLELYTTPYVEYLSGSWDEAKQTVVIGSGEEAVESYTQWYCVRQSAKAILYQCANSSVQHNGYSELSVNGTELNATEGVSFEGSVAIGALLDASSSCLVSVEGNLPEGIELDEVTGALSGKAAQSGNFMFTVNYLIDGYIEKSAAYTLKVAPCFTFEDGSDDLTSIDAGADVYAKYTSSVYTTEGGKYDSVTYAVKEGALPAGLTLSQDGEIAGKVTAESGTYTAVIEVTGSKESSDGGFGGSSGGGSSSSSETTTVTLTITVNGAPRTWTENVPYIENGTWHVNGNDLGIAATGEKGDKGDKGDTGATGATGATGEAGKDACSSSVAGAEAAVITAVITVMAAAFILLRKKED